MRRKGLARMALGLGCVAALAVPVAADAGPSGSKGHGRTFYATDDKGNLVSFSANNPRKLDSTQQITGLPMGVTLRGIDFRPATGELYGVGSDSVVYRVSPVTARAVAEGPSFTPTLNGRFFGIDFRPATGDLYGVGSDSVVYRLNPRTGIAVAEARRSHPASTAASSASTSTRPSTGSA
jgi:hypothetical protein